jgi:hypothetical protein
MTDWSALIAVFIAVLAGAIFNNQRVGSLQREIDMLRSSLLAELAAMKRELLAELKVVEAKVDGHSRRLDALERATRES